MIQRDWPVKNGYGPVNLWIAMSLVNDTAAGSASSIHSKREIPARVPFTDSDLPSLGWPALLRYLAATLDPSLAGARALLY